ncbi:TetR/AcrR family transcriptional regulator [Actinoplanes sp. NPDC049596]|uniref:TetR/AcrR family transcriptional regulator n=1 Tax=unclassified Actinoplanes TaxID=2626549 RepID=UPI00343F8941
MSPRSTRDRPAKAPLSEEAIVGAAIGILRSEGLEAMSMRRVAAALDTGAGSLYVYFANREALIEAVFDRVAATVELEPPRADRWREQLQAVLTRTRDALVAHPGITAAVMVDPPRTYASMRLQENLLGLLFAGGLGPRDAAWTADTLFAQVTHAAVEAETRTADPAELARQVSANFAQLPADEFPLITAHAATIVSGDFDQRFHYAIDIVIEGALRKAKAEQG